MLHDPWCPNMKNPFFPKKFTPKHKKRSDHIKSTLSSNKYYDNNPPIAQLQSNFSIREFSEKRSGVNFADSFEKCPAFRFRFSERSFCWCQPTKNWRFFFLCCSCGDAVFIVASTQLLNSLSLSNWKYIRDRWWCLIN